LLFVFAMGEIVARYSPWQLIHSLPILYSTRVASRFLIPFTMMIAVLAGFGVDFIARRQERAGRIAAAFLIALCVIDLFAVGVPNSGYFVEDDPPPLDQHDRFIQIYQSSIQDMDGMARSNRGALNCREYTSFPTRVTGFDQPGYRGEQYLLGPGIVALSKWSPNALTFSINARRPEIMVVNQNFDDGWRVTSGAGRVVSHNTMLALLVPPGAQNVTITYTNRYFDIGAIVTILAFLAFVLLLYGAWRGHLAHEKKPA